jgi:hypothetical protein
VSIGVGTASRGATGPAAHGAALPLTYLTDVVDRAFPFAEAAPHAHIEAQRNIAPPLQERAG